MEQNYKDILTAVRTELLESINACHYKDIIDGLHSKNILTLEERNELNQGSDQLQLILDTLPKRGIEAYDTFIQVLDDCGERYAANLLEHSVKFWLLTESDKELQEVWPNNDSKVISVTKVPDENEDMKRLFQKAMKGETLVYAMHSPSRGIFLLIDNENFEETQKKLNIPEEDRLKDRKGTKEDAGDVLTEEDKRKDRKGTKEDARVLTELFNQLHFRVVKKEDLSAKEMLDAVQNQVAEVKATDNCFVCAVLSHGNPGVVYGVDEETVALKNLKDAVMNCPQLDGKPKIFLIQACQGSKGMSSTCDMDGAAFSPEEQSEQMDLQEIADELAGVCNKESDKPIKTKSDAKPKPDIFVAMATIPDFVSRHTTRGTWFMQDLTFIFSHLAHKYDLIDLTTKVNYLVSLRETRFGCKQVSVFSSSLTKKFYFFPGLKTLDD